ncbi:MAG TPA: hypothetical protein VGR72_03840 [Candidatus Acidoferrales bacterium]|nr:hypothetical protein [Candidatus Acidoferrales bacterium]
MTKAHGTIEERRAKVERQNPRIKLEGLWALVIAGMLLVVTASSVKAQHGTAGGGYYPPGYGGDTWTGVVTTTDDTSRTVTLTYSNKKKTETFTGVLKEGCCKVKMSDGTVQELKPSELSPGRRIMVYYIPRTTKDEGKKSTVNEIFKVDFLK